MGSNNLPLSNKDKNGPIATNININSGNGSSPHLCLHSSLLHNDNLTNPLASGHSSSPHGHHSGNASTTALPADWVTTPAPDDPDDPAQYISGLAPNIDPELLASLDLQKIRAHQQQISNIWPELSAQARIDFPEFPSLYNTIKSNNLPNFLGTQVTLNSGLNLAKWEEKLQLYHDKENCHYLRFRWPVGYEADTPPTQVLQNHPSGRQHVQQIKDFVNK